MSPPPKVNVEEAFDAWYGAGDRKTLAAVAAEFGVSYRTMLRYSEDGDWTVRADRLDEAIQRERDQKLVAMIGRQRARTMEATATIMGRFFMRLPAKIAHPETGAIVDNPAYLDPKELSVQDFERVVKLFELLAGNPVFRVAVGEGDGPDRDLSAALEEMQQRIIAAEMATAGELPAELEGGTGGEG